jgi:hypothetical protein
MFASGGVSIRRVPGGIGVAVDYASNHLNATDPIVIFFVYFALLDNEYQPKGRILAVL